LGTSQGNRLAHLRNQIPNLVLIALLWLTVMSVGIAGYAGRVDVHRSRAPVYLTGLLICGLIYVVLDLDGPADGIITISQQPLYDVVDSMAAFSH